MNIKTKRLIVIVVAVLFCIGISFVAIQFAQKRNVKKALERYKTFEGRWSDVDGKIDLEIRRVTPSNMIITIRNNRSEGKITCISAVSVEENYYRFTYDVNPVYEDLEQILVDSYKASYGVGQEGYIRLQEGEVVIEFSPNAQHPEFMPGYALTLSKKENFKTDKQIHLLEYIGSDKEISKELEESVCFERDEENKVWRIHAVFDKNPNEMYEMDVAGISKLCFQTDCEERFGKPSETFETVYGGKGMIFYDETYRYKIVYSPYGIVTEAEVCLKNLPGFEWKNDFLVKGDTIIRYVGDWLHVTDDIDVEVIKEIDFPENIKKIAKGAFYLDSCDFHPDRVVTQKIIIPKEVIIEPDAFAHCGPLEIEFEEGRKVIEKGSFAHMVALEEYKEKDYWVEVDVPESIEKIEEMAFGLEDSGKEKENEFKAVLTKTKDGELLDDYKPIIITFANEKWEEQIEIGENALWGCYIDKWLEY